MTDHPNRSWKSDPKFCFILGCVKEYIDSCAEYDKEVCPLRFEGWPVPETPRQWELITHNARIKREELLFEAESIFKISRKIAIAYWDKALRMGGAIGDD